MSGMIIEIAQGEVLTIGDTQVRLIHKSGRKARLQVDAPKHIPIQQPRSAAKAARMSVLPTNQEQPHGQHPIRQGSPTLP